MPTKNLSDIASASAAIFAGTVWPWFPGGGDEFCSVMEFFSLPCMVDAEDRDHHRRIGTVMANHGCKPLMVGYFAAGRTED